MDINTTATMGTGVNYSFCLTRQMRDLSRGYINRIITVQYGHFLGDQGALLLTWFNFNPGMDKYSHDQ